MSSIESASADEPQAWFKLDRDGRKLAMGGDWTIGESARLDRELSGLALEGRGDIAIDAALHVGETEGANQALRNAIALDDSQGFIPGRHFAAVGKLKAAEPQAGVRALEPHETLLKENTGGVLTVVIGRVIRRAQT